MDFSERILSLDAEPTLLRCPIDSVHAYALMIAPVYLRLRLNEKYIAAKAPLDFFTPEELARLAPLGDFYFSKFIKSAVPFRDAGMKVRAMLAWTPKAKAVEQAADDLQAVVLPPAPYEVSDAVLRLIAPLWGKSDADPKLGIEPFFCVAFANELCSTLPPEVLVRAREADLARYERGVLLSSWAVMSGLMLGYQDLGFLESLRLRVFRRVSLGEFGESDFTDIDQLESLALSIFGAVAGDGETPRRITLYAVASRPERAARKLVARLRRLDTELSSEVKDTLPTIYGDRGFAHG